MNRREICNDLTHSYSVVVKSRQRLKKERKKERGTNSSALRVDKAAWC